jgi:hypothetical protein
LPGELENTEFGTEYAFFQNRRKDEERFLLDFLADSHIWLNLPGKIASLATNKIRKEKKKAALAYV